MSYKVKPIINETILNINDAIQCDTDEVMLRIWLLYACLASLTVGDGSAITTESFNADDTHKLINIVVLS